MRVGIAIELQEGVSWVEWIKCVELAESLGFDSIWVSDHLRSIDTRKASLALEPFAALAAAAVTTSRVGLGTLVAPITFRNPVSLARLGRTMAEASLGRFTLGLGTGWHEEEHLEHGLRFPAAHERLDDLEATLEKLDHYLINTSRPPILIGGAGERRTLRLVARYADMWNGPGLTIDQFRRKRAVLNRWCSALGREADRIQLSVLFTHAIAYSPLEVEARTAAIKTRTPPRFRPGYGPEAPQWLLGSPTDVAELLAGYAAEGLDLAILQWRGPPQPGELEAAAAVVELVSAC